MQTKSRATFILAIVGVSASAGAGPNTVHKSLETHSDTMWTNNETWETVGGGTVVPDDPNLDTEWFVDASDFLPDMMFQYDAMDGLMNPMFSVGTADLTSHGMSISRSVAGLPQTLEVTINSESWHGAEGFALELQGPVMVTMEFVGMSPASTAGLYNAKYEGLMSGAVYMVSHNSLAAGPQIVDQESPSLFELEILTEEIGLCPGDIADDFGTIGGDGQVSFGDFLALLSVVGPCGGGTVGCIGDIADDFGSIGGDGQVSFGDFLALLALVGPCP